MRMLPTCRGGGHTRRLAAGTAVAIGVLLGHLPPAAAQPAEPPAPPVSNPESAVSDRCAPDATTVVRDIPWAQQRLLPHRVWPLTRGNGQLVAVIDTGVDAAVPQLSGRVLAGQDLTAGPGTAADTDCVGHGTFIAGIIAAAQVDGIGFAGIAPAATILPIRQASAGSGGTASVLASAIRAAVAAGAGVVNISVVSVHSSPELEAAVAEALRRDVVVVAAASNDAENGNPKAYPAAYPGVLAVGAIGADGNRADFSETGAYIGVAAPGVDVISVGPRGPGHLVGRGTSYAAPFVAGVAALVRSYRPELTAAQVKHRLEITADHPASALPSPQLGWGVVNPYAAVTAVLPEEREGHTAAAASPVTVAGPVWPAPADPRTAVALIVGGAAALLAGLAAAAAAVLPRGRRRGWQSIRARDEAGVGSG